MRNPDPWLRGQAFPKTQYGTVHGCVGQKDEKWGGLNQQRGPGSGTKKKGVGEHNARPKVQEQLTAS